MDKMNTGKRWRKEMEESKQKRRTLRERAGKNMEGMPKYNCENYLKVEQEEEAKERGVESIKREEKGGKRESRKEGEEKDNKTNNKSKIRRTE